MLYRKFKTYNPVVLINNDFDLFGKSIEEIKRDKLLFLIKNFNIKEYIYNKKFDNGKNDHHLNDYVYKVFESLNLDIKKLDFVNGTLYKECAITREYIPIATLNENKCTCPCCGEKCLNYNQPYEGIVYDNFLCNADKKIKRHKNLMDIKNFIISNLEKNKIGYTINYSNISNSLYISTFYRKIRVSDHNDTGKGKYYFGANDYDLIITHNNFLNVKINVRQILKDLIR